MAIEDYSTGRDEAVDAARYGESRVPETVWASLGTLKCSQWKVDI